jgi:hypothetical protein
MVNFYVSCDNKRSHSIPKVRDNIVESGISRRGQVT